MGSGGESGFLPLQVAAVCYRRRGVALEFLLVKTTGGDKWTFPKGATAPRLSHAQAAEREALEEAGAVGTIEHQHFHLYLHPKRAFSRHNGAQEFVVKAFLMEVTHLQRDHEPRRNPTWFSVDNARETLAQGRETRYAAELRTVIDRAVEHLSAQESSVPDYSRSLTHRIWRSFLRVLRLGPVR